MVQREGGNDDLYAWAKVVTDKRQQLLRVGYQVAVREHGALGYTGGTAGVLQCCDGVRSHTRQVLLGGFRVSLLFSRGQCLLERSVRDRNFGKRSAPDLLDQADNPSDHRREKLGNLNRHHVRDRRLVQDSGEAIGKHVDNYQRGSARIRKLVNHF